MKKCLQIEEVQEPELMDVRWDISSSFKKISCFLMPDPGKKVSATFLMTPKQLGSCAGQVGEDI